MPTPTPPPTDAIPSQHQHAGIDPQLFWEEHKSKIILFGTLLIVALLIFAIYEYTTQARAKAAGGLLAHANKPEDYKALIEKYPRTIAAGNACLVLAKQQRDEKKYDDALATLRMFTEKFTDHPLVHAGWLSLGQTQEAAGKTDEALGTYQQVATRYSDSYSAPLATLAQANLLKTKGKPDEAKRIYENFIAQFPESAFTQEAMREMKLLRK